MSDSAHQHQVTIATSIATLHLSVEDRLHSFDQATQRQMLREKSVAVIAALPEAGRGWTREELYRRGAN